MSVMTDVNLTHNCVNETGTPSEGFSHGRCSIVQQDGPGRHQATAARIRRRWSQNDNRIVMECYYRSEPRKIGYRKRMHQLWIDREMFPVTEQRLLDQKSQIVQKQWLSRLELEEIARAVEDGEYGSIRGDLEHEEAERSINHQEPDIQTERDRTENDVFALKDRVDITEEEICLLQRLNEIRKMDRTRLPALREVESEKLRKAVKKLDVLLEKIKVDDITDVNDLIYCASAVVVENLGVKREWGSKSKEP